MQQPAEVDVDEDQPIVERLAAIDVAKGTGMVCTRVPHASIVGKRVTKVWEVKATTKALLELADLGVDLRLLATLLIHLDAPTVSGKRGCPSAEKVP